MNKFKNSLRCHPTRTSMNRTVLFSFLLILLSACPGWGATYYVKTGGNDSLDGLSDATAWGTISKVSAKVVSGDTVYFRSQDTWSATALPALTAKAGVTYDGSTYGNGTRATLRATGGYTGNSIDGVVNIYVSNVTFKGFEVNGNAQVTGGIYLGFHAATDTSNITIDNCVVHDTGGPESTPTKYSYGILVGQATYHTLSNVTITTTTVYNTGHEGISVYPSRGTGGDNHVDNVLIRNCVVHDTAHWGGTTWGNAIDMANHVTNLTIEYNTAYNAGSNGIAIVTYADIPSPGSPDTIIVRYNIIYNNAIGIGIYPNLGHGHFGNSYIYGNILIDNGIFLSGGNYNSTIQKIYNNTIYIPAAMQYGVYFVDYSTSNTGGIDFKNNILYTSSLATIKDDRGNLVAHSNNLLYRSSGTFVTTSAHDYNSSDIETWEASVKKTDPTFTGGTLPTGFSGTYGINMVPNTNYFDITSGDALNNGATLENPYDTCINGAGLATPIIRPSGAYDIGAYEHGGTTRPAKVEGYKIAPNLQ